MSNNPLPSSFDGNTDFYEENRWQKFSRRLKEEPLIPLGCLLTCAALLGATRSIRAGDHNRTNRMFRARIYAQGFTLVAMVAGSMYWQTDRQKRKEFDVAVAERKAKEKNEAWIRELEARDEEERELKEMRRRRAEGRGSRKDVEQGEVEEGRRKDQRKRVAATIAEKVADEGKEASKVGEKEEGKGVLGSVQDLVWGKK